MRGHRLLAEGFAGSFWARLCVQGSACVLNPLIVVPDPNLAAPARTASWLCAPRRHKPRCMVHFGPVRVRLLRGGSRTPACLSRVRGATEKTRGGEGGVRPRDEWTPSALPRYSELLTANMLTPLRRLRVKQRCRRSGAPPGHDPASVGRVRRQMRGVWVEFGPVLDGTGEASWHGDGRRDRGY